ncbi:piwi-like protein Siwi isoform X2 [Periplaneta americana]|uniref:piwi-like protein Siwi isoform X2 n=1 Tax=Periplaneta americana TaxID=6978 RepID=UPI0037E87E3B
MIVELMTVRVIVFWSSVSCLQIMDDHPKPIGRTRGRAVRPAMPRKQAAKLVPLSTENEEAVSRNGSSTTSSGIESCSDICHDVRELDKQLSGLEIDLSKAAAPRTRTQDRPPRGGSAAVSERGKMRKNSRAKESLESTIWTKPNEMPSKRGNTGQSVRLHANYFRLLTVTNWQLYQYRVDFDPEEDRNVVKRRMLHDCKGALGGFLFDGTVLFTSTKYNPDPLVIFSTRPSDKQKIRITIRCVGVLEFGDYHYVHFFNLLVRLCLDKLKLQLVGRHYYDSLARINVDKHRLELWPGYVTSIRQHESELLLCTEVIHKVMRQDTVYTLLTECYGRNAGDYQKLFKQAVLGTIVLTDYNNKTYCVDDVDFSVTPASSFERDGVQITYMEYFLQKYELKIKHSMQPMLVTMPKQRERRRGQSTPIYLVPELCRMTGLSEVMRTNFTLMKDLADCTRLGPSQRMERLQHFNRRLHSNSLIAAELESWNMKMSENLVTLSGRILPRERVILGVSNGQDNIKCDAGPTNDWTKALRLTPMLKTLEVESWAVVVPTHLRRDVTQFVTTLRTAAYKMELMLPDATYRELPDDRMANYVEAIDSAILSCNPRLILIVLPNNRLDRYSAIKKKCCVEHAVPTQLILHKNLTSKNVMSIATKVAIQMNCKIGGAPWTVEIPLQRGMSIGALVASLDRPMSRYFSAVSYHRTGEELSNELSANICKALRKYMEYNKNCLPQRIVVYRDGVGEGQIPYVFQHEVALLKAKLQQIYGERECKMAFIIVTKRINTRLFYNGNNPLPGTVVDDVITLPERYDFFLVSQSVRQGTVSPTSYNVICDNLGLDPDKLQRLTYKLTHLYFNWSGTVRVPAPVQYSHKLAYLVGQALHKIPNSHLEELLYFL